MPEKELAYSNEIVKEYEELSKRCDNALNRIRKRRNDKKGRRDTSKG